MQNETFTPAASPAPQEDAEGQLLPPADSILSQACARARQTLPRLTSIAGQAALTSFAILTDVPDFWGGGNVRGC